MKRLLEMNRTVQKFRRSEFLANIDKARSLFEGIRNINVSGNEDRILVDVENALRHLDCAADVDFEGAIAAQTADNYSLLDALTNKKAACEDKLQRRFMRELSNPWGFRVVAP